MRHVPYESGFMFAAAEPAHERVYLGHPVYNGDKALVTLEDAQVAIKAAVEAALKEHNVRPTAVDYIPY